MENNNEDEPKLLQKAKREYHGHHHDSTRWEKVQMRKSDIVVSTAYKSGTTWTMAILANLLFDEEKFPGPVLDMFPWVDMRIPPIEAVTSLASVEHRRVLKTHLPADAINFYSDVKYIVINRDSRDVFMSLLNHWSSFADGMYERMNNNPSGKICPKPGDDINAMYKDWITKGYMEGETDGYPFWSYFTHLVTWWELKDQPNVLFLHYADMKKDIASCIRKIATFIDLPLSEEKLSTVCSNVSIDHMRDNADIYLSEGINHSFKEKENSFLYKGTNGRWTDILNDENLELYRQTISRLPADAVAWSERS